MVKRFCNNYAKTAKDLGRPWALIMMRSFLVKSQILGVGDSYIPIPIPIGYIQTLLHITHVCYNVDQSFWIGIAGYGSDQKILLFWVKNVALPAAQMA